MLATAGGRNVIYSSVTGGQMSSVSQQFAHQTIPSTSPDQSLVHKYQNMVLAVSRAEKTVLLVAWSFCGAM